MEIIEGMDYKDDTIKRVFILTVTYVDNDTVHYDAFDTVTKRKGTGYTMKSSRFRYPMMYTKVKDNKLARKMAKKIHKEENGWLYVEI